MTNRREQWENIYRTKARNEQSWYREHLDSSLRRIAEIGVRNDEAVIDVGCGSSTLIDDLSEKGFTDLTALDISETALSDIRSRLGERSGPIHWIAADITDTELPENRFDVWHDRAVFHFLTDVESRKKYVRLLNRSLKTGGRFLISAFAVDGPERCSGLEIQQYSPETLHIELGTDFTLTDSFYDDHATPFGTTQKFVHCVFEKRGI